MANLIKDYINGFITVKVEGLNPEKFINLSTKRGIRLYNIKKINYTTIQFRMKFKQYKLLSEVNKKTNCKSRIMRKNGFEFLLNKLNRRKSFIIGVFVFLSVIFFLSSVIWNIDITGNKKISNQRILSALKKSGISVGSFKYNINARSVEQNTLKQIDEISMINIKLIGTNVKVEIIERTMPPKIDINRPSNVVASKEGIISKLLSYKGQMKVNEGDYVKKGQVLISCVISDDLNNTTQIVHALGDVYANVWYENIQCVNLKYKYYVKTGNVKKTIYFRFKNKAFYLKKDNISFFKYDKIKEIKRYKLLLGDSYIEKITDSYFEKVEKVKQLSYNDAYKMAVRTAENNIYLKMPKNRKIVSKKIYKSYCKGYIKVRALFITEEKIGVNKYIK